MCRDNGITSVLTYLADALADEAHRNFMDTGNEYERGRADALTVIIVAANDMREGSLMRRLARRALHWAHAAWQLARTEAGQWRHYWREKLWMAGWRHWPVQRELREGQEQ